MNDSKAIFRAGAIRLAWIYGVCVLVIGGFWLHHFVPQRNVPRPVPITTVVPYRGTTVIPTYESPCNGPIVITGGHGNLCGGG